MGNKRPVPEETIKRLSVYLRILKVMGQKGHSVVSSQRLTRGLAVTGAQVRRDLAYFGSFGRAGIGYNVRQLREEIERILGLNRGWQVILVGAGKLGSALLHYPVFYSFGFKMVAAFDNNPARIGRRIGGVTVQDEQKMSDFIREHDIRTAIITVPAQAAQEIVDRLVESGVSAILNFAPCYLAIKKGVHIKNVDLTMELETLVYYLANSSRKRKDARG